MLARLARWCVGSRQRGFKSTLSLIPIGKYSQVYQELKAKYKDMVKVILGRKVFCPPPTPAPAKWGVYRTEYAGDTVFPVYLLGPIDADLKSIYTH